MAFPATRLRRLRKSGVLRDLVRETQLDVRRLVYPMFVVLGLEGREPIAGMPGIDRLSISAAVAEAGEAAALGIPAVNYGPGEPEVAHSRGEYVEIPKIAECEDRLRAWLAG